MTTLGCRSYGQFLTLFSMHLIIPATYNLHLQYLSIKNIPKKKQFLILCFKFFFEIIYPQLTPSFDYTIISIQNSVPAHINSNGYCVPKPQFLKRVFKIFNFIFVSIEKRRKKRLRISLTKHEFIALNTYLLPFSKQN